MSEETKVGGLGKLDVFLGLVCAILFADVIASNTSTGVPVITWWIIIGLLFYIPNGFITAELSATYPDKGGIYSWVSRAYGKKWGARLSYYYWVNNAIWISSAYIWFSGLLASIFFPSLPFIAEVAIGIGMTWLTVWIASKPMVESKWVTNLAAIAKLTIFAVVIVSGAVYFFKSGTTSNVIEWKAFVPNFDQALIYLPIMVYSCCGLEVLSASAHEMENPKRDLPKSIITVALMVIVLNVLASLATLATVPLNSLDLISGVTDAIAIGLNASPAFIMIIAAIFLYSILAQVVTWTLGTCWGAMEAGASGELPKYFGKEGKGGIPIGALQITGITTTIIFIVYGVMATNSADLFYTLLAFSSIIFFVPYILMFGAYLKLKRTDTTAIRTFVAPMGSFFSYVCLFVLISACVLFVWVPGQPFDAAYAVPILIGLIVVMGIGEGLIVYSRNLAKASEAEKAA